MGAKKKSSSSSSSATTPGPLPIAMTKAMASSDKGRGSGSGSGKKGGSGDDENDQSRKGGSEGSKSGSGGHQMKSLVSLEGYTAAFDQVAEQIKAEIEEPVRVPPTGGAKEVLDRARVEWFKDGLKRAQRDQDAAMAKLGFTSEHTGGYGDERLKGIYTEETLLTGVELFLTTMIDEQDPDVKRIDPDATRSIIKWMEDPEYGLQGGYAGPLSRPVPPPSSSGPSKDRLLPTPFPPATPVIRTSKEEIASALALSSVGEQLAQAAADTTVLWELDQTPPVPRIDGSARVTTASEETQEAVVDEFKKKLKALVGTPVANMSPEQVELWAALEEHFAFTWRDAGSIESWVEQPSLSEGDVQAPTDLLPSHFGSVPLGEELGVGQEGPGSPLGSSVIWEDPPAVTDPALLKVLDLVKAAEDKDGKDGKGLSEEEAVVAGEKSDLALSPEVVREALDQLWTLGLIYRAQNGAFVRTVKPQN